MRWLALPGYSTEGPPSCGGWAGVFILSSPDSEPYENTGPLAWVSGPRTIALEAE